jgi:hypothetical protein
MITATSGTTIVVSDVTATNTFTISAARFHAWLRRWQMLDLAWSLGWYGDDPGVSYAGAMHEVATDRGRTWEDAQ